MKFFGITNEEEIGEFNNIKDYQRILIERNILSVATTFDVKTGKLELKLKPTIPLRKEFEQFIYNFYDDLITSEKYGFFAKFEEKIFGKDLKSSKKEALKAFNKIYKKLGIDSIYIPKPNISDNGIKHHNVVSRMEKIKYAKNGLKENFSSDIELIMEYLTGNKEYFSLSLLEQNVTFLKRIRRAIDIEILIELNDRYYFETTKFFGKKAFVKELHDKYQNITESYNLFDFIYNTIDGFENIKKAQISSLYCALVRKKLTEVKPKPFMGFIYSEFKIKLTKLPNPYSELSNAAEKRISDFITQLDKLDA